MRLDVVAPREGDKGFVRVGAIGDIGAQNARDDIVARRRLLRSE